MSTKCETHLRTARTSAYAFTLVELLIVVVILGILAATVIPMFSEAASDSKNAALASNLRLIRDAIERYKYQHAGRGPNIKENGGTDNNDDNFIARLTGKTDGLGKIDATGSFGPYILRWPSNPYASNATQADAIKINPAAPGSGAHGWHFSHASEIFSANSAAHVGW